MQKKPVLLIILLLLSCRTRMYEEAGQILQKMTPEEKIGQMLMAGVPGQKISAESKAIIEKYCPGGIILFGFNLGSEEEIKTFIGDMQKNAFAKYSLPLFISIDQEGGRVKRITEGVTQFPGNMALGIVNDKDLTYKAARIIGLELRAIGVNMNLAPVLDVNNNPSNPVINTRSFGSDTEIVSALGRAYIRGLQESGCIAAAKHFPGHGDTDKDSHQVLPVIRYELTRLRNVEFPPFKEAVDSGVEAVMSAHISYPNILGNNLPATISRRFLTDILRGELGFQGIIITDDMEMNAISMQMDIGEAAVRSVEAGADIVLISTHGKHVDIITSSIMKAVRDGRITQERIDESVKKIIEVKLRYKLMTLNKDTIEYDGFTPPAEETDILKEAEKINSRISREAIYYHAAGKQPSAPAPAPGFMFFITSNSNFACQLRSSFSKEDIVIFTAEKDFIKFMENGLPEKYKQNYSKNLQVYYQFNNAEPEMISRLGDITGRAGIPFCLICTGNPFLLKDIKELPSLYCTFSNTDESLRQMVSCIKGEFKPKEKINISLGFNNE